jgi:hypothetical protein
MGVVFRWMRASEAVRAERRKSARQRCIYTRPLGDKNWPVRIRGYRLGCQDMVKSDRTRITNT